jgi:hypothetical protein
MVTKQDNEIFIAVKKFDITPSTPVSLLGYFNERISEGVLDPLYCRITALKKGEKNLLFIQIDSCLIETEDAMNLKNRISKSTCFKPEEILIFTSHTHTAPALSNFFATKKEKAYTAWLFERIFQEVIKLNPDQSHRVRVSKVRYRDLCYNRRWFLKDGRVVTNPPKASTELYRPEGPVDRELITIAFYKDNKQKKSVSSTPALLFINISNHTDTVGGNMISADWPGVMERRIAEMLGVEIPVFTLIAPQGNINHFDFHSKRSQTCYSETIRIGSRYAEIVFNSLPEAKPILIDKLTGIQSFISIPPREIVESDIEKAKTLFEVHGAETPSKDLTAEDLARDDPAVRRLFAEALLEFASKRESSYMVPLQFLQLGSIAFCAIPGEPFVEIGINLKRMRRDRIVIPVALANGYFGYIPIEECFERGGYEVKASVYNPLSRKASEFILDWFKKVLEK